MVQAAKRIDYNPHGIMFSACLDDEKFYEAVGEVALSQHNIYKLFLLSVPIIIGFCKYLDADTLG